jgi:hypothetical protein
MLVQQGTQYVARLRLRSIKVGMVAATGPPACQLTSKVHA